MWLLRDGLCAVWEGLVVVGGVVGVGLVRALGEEATQPGQAQQAEYEQGSHLVGLVQCCRVLRGG